MNTCKVQSLVTRMCSCTMVVPHRECAHRLQSPTLWPVSFSGCTAAVLQVFKGTEALTAPEWGALNTVSRMA